jgi:TolA-binding protein
MKQRDRKIRIIERVIDAMGSIASLVIHTLVFSGFFLSAYLGFLTLDSMLLILTTVVSLEAIYLALFIQMTVNENTKSLREVEEDIEDIQEDVEELGEDLEDIQEDIEEMSEDIEDIQEDVEEMSEEDKEEERREKADSDSLERLTADVRRILADLEALKKVK